MRLPYPDEAAVPERILLPIPHLSPARAASPRTADLAVLPRVSSDRTGASYPVVVEGPAAGRVALYERDGELWRRAGDGSAGGNIVGVGALPPAPDGGPERFAREFLLRLEGRAVPCRIEPVALCSSLDPVRRVFVVGNSRTASFLSVLQEFCRSAGVPLTVLETEEAGSDLWMQDTVEICSSVPGADADREAIPVALLGLRARHDCGLSCGPLDAAAADWFSRELPEAVCFRPGSPRSGARWIDWYGNLEVSPPVPGFPRGRILTGRQGNLTLHDAVMEFLRAQELQWPPLVLDLSWLLIGHVDEVVNFVPAPDRHGFRLLVPDPELTRELLREAQQRAGGDTLVFAGRSEQTTVNALLAFAEGEEARRVERNLTAIRGQLGRELGIAPEDFLGLPVLFRNGAALTPNTVNSLVVGRQMLAPAPEGPQVEGEDLLESWIRKRLLALGVTVQFADTWEVFHRRGGEIHCGTNTLRTRS